MKIKFVFRFVLINCVIRLVHGDSTVRQKLGEYYEKSDINEDGFLDRKELATFVQSMFPIALDPIKLDSDTLETTQLLAEKLFDEVDPQPNGKISFKGSLLFRSPASMFGDRLMNMLLDMSEQVDALENDFSNLSLKFK